MSPTLATPNLRHPLLVDAVPSSGLGTRFLTGPDGDNVRISQFCPSRPNAMCQEAQREGVAGVISICDVLKVGKPIVPLNTILVVDGEAKQMGSEESLRDEPVDLKVFVSAVGTKMHDPVAVNIGGLTLDVSRPSVRGFRNSLHVTKVRNLVESFKTNNWKPVFHVVIVSLIWTLTQLVSAQTIGSGVTIGQGVSVGAPFTSAPLPGIVFSPDGQHFSGTVSPTIAYPPDSTASIFYNTAGYLVSPADTLYSSALSLNSTTTVSALAYIAGTVRQNLDRSSAAWKTDVAATPLPSGTCPSVSVGGGVGNNAIDTCTFDTTAQGNTALHLAFSSSQSGTSQRQVLWAMSGGKCNDCTEWTQSFDIEAGENQANAWAYENDAELWDDSRSLELTCGLQCLQGNGSNIWEISGQSGWTSSGAACSLSSSQFTHVESHCHRVVGNKACSWTGKTSSSITSTAQTTFTVTQRVTPGMVLTLGSEQMLATAFNASTSTVTVTRGYNGTTPGASYASGTAWGAPTECIYYDWISINGVKTTLNKTFTAAPLPQGWSGNCINQQQLDTTHSGVVGEYIKNKNMTCGYGTQATGTATYTNP